jgi:hypothetical protein
MFGSYRGENLTPILYSIVKDFMISETLGYLTTNNIDLYSLAINKLYQAIIYNNNNSVLNLIY